ncbi:MAG TPA: hypothetical protein ENJ63_00015, partial [Dissulfuribacter thermophilus]|nr:hypothetical protein [Dissulfuribacter thermophilus]
MFQEIQPTDFPEKPPLINGLTPQQMRQWKVLPISVEDDAVKVAMTRPEDLYLIEILENIYSRPLK